LITTIITLTWTKDTIYSEMKTKKKLTLEALNLCPKLSEAIRRANDYSNIFKTVTLKFNLVG